MQWVCFIMGVCNRDDADVFAEANELSIQLDYTAANTSGNGES